MEKTQQQQNPNLIHKNNNTGLPFHSSVYRQKRR